MIFNVHAKIIDIGVKIHDAMSLFVEENNISDLSEDLTGACAIASWFLHQELKKINIKTDFCAATNHAFITYNDVIYDITVTQFGMKEKVFFISLFDHFYNLHEELHYAYTYEYYGNIDYVNNDWPLYQRPLLYQLQTINNNYKIKFLTK